MASLVDMSGRDDYNNVVCYDMDRKFLGGCFRAESGKVYDNYVITLPSEYPFHLCHHQ